MPADITGNNQKETIHILATPNAPSRRSATGKTKRRNGGSRKDDIKDEQGATRTV